MANSLNADFLIIGAGAAGLSLACELSEFAGVIVLEQEAGPGYHATGRSAAIFVGGYGDHVVRTLSAASRPLLDNPPFITDSALIAWPRGLAYVARTNSERLSAADSRALLPRLTPRQIRERVPILREDAIAFAHWDERAADIDVHAMLTGLLRRIKARGGRIIFGVSFAGARREKGHWIIDAGAATIRVPIIVNAAGAWAARVGSLLGAGNLPLVPFRRTAGTIAGPMGVDMSAWPMIVDVEETIYFKPDAGSLMLSPVDEEATEPHDAFADEVNVATAVHRFELLTSHTVQRVIAQWAGLRTMAPDRRPVIGYDATVEGLFWLAGQGGFGIQTALGAAALSRSLLISGTGDLPNGLASVAPLVSPARFGQLCV